MGRCRICLAAGGGGAGADRGMVPLACSILLLSAAPSFETVGWPARAASDVRDARDRHLGRADGYGLGRRWASVNVALAMIWCSSRCHGVDAASSFARRCF